MNYYYIVGSGAFGNEGYDGLATAAQIFISGLVVHATGNLFFCETRNNKIRRIDAVSGIITTFAG